MVYLSEAVVFPQYTFLFRSLLGWNSAPFVGATVQDPSSAVTFLVEDRSTRVVPPRWSSLVSYSSGAVPVLLLSLSVVVLYSSVAVAVHLINDLRIKG